MTDDYLGISLSTDEKSRVRRAAAAADKTMSEFVRDNLTEWLDEQAIEE